MMNKSKLTVFLDKNKISYFPLNLVIDKYKKVPAPYGQGSGEAGTMPSYTDFKNKPEAVKTRKANLEKYNYIWIDTATIFQLDIDNKEYYEKNKEIFEHKFSYFKSVTKKLPHYFVRTTSDPKFSGKGGNAKGPLHHSIGPVGSATSSKIGEGGDNAGESDAGESLSSDHDHAAMLE